MDPLAQVKISENDLQAVFKSNSKKVSTSNSMLYDNFSSVLSEWYIINWCVFFQFLVCGNLSLYTGAHPSKKMVSEIICTWCVSFLIMNAFFKWFSLYLCQVTVCFAMYLVSLLGIIVSLSNRIYYMAEFGHLFHYSFREHEWTISRIVRYIFYLLTLTQ